MDGDTLRDLSGVIDDITGDTLDDATLDRLRAIDPATLPAVSGTPRIGPCVGNIGKFMCIGLNYNDHAIETGNPFPDHPVLFMKANSRHRRPQRRHRHAARIDQHRLGGRTGRS